jgi:hypothetical protein
MNLVRACMDALKKTNKEIKQWKKYIFVT